LFIPDPDADFYPSRIPDPGVKKAPDPRSGSATMAGTPATAEKPRKHGRQPKKRRRNSSNKNNNIVIGVF
jgi:hypothetical protein